MRTLALFGGKPVRTEKYPWHVTTNGKEKEEVMKVLKKGVLSAFEGSNNEFFLGGEEVKRFEREFEKKLKVKHAISVNSATSGLYAAVGAAGVGPGDEVIVPPWTMTATASAVLVYNAIPVFCDITTDTYTLDPSKLEDMITDRTKAIMPVHIFGHPADMDEIMEIAEKYDLFVIEDAAQSIGGKYKGRHTGTIGDMGVFSFNSNKIIQCGEGGIVATNDYELAQKLRLIRNHAEAVIATGMHVNSLVNMLGWNYRMNEIEAAICRVQLKKLDRVLKQRRKLVEYLNRKMKTLDGIETPRVKEGCTHTYYRYAVRLDKNKIHVPIDKFLKALNAEGMDFYKAYLPLYLFPIYQKKIVYGDKGCPFSCQYYGRKIEYREGLCSNAEKLREEVISTEVVRPPLTYEDMNEIYEAFEKVLESVDKLKAKAEL